MTILANQRPDLAVVDFGDRGHGAEATRVLIGGIRRGLTPRLVAGLRRQSANEAEIGHMKHDGRLARCLLKSTIDDALFAVFCTCSHNTARFSPTSGIGLPASSPSFGPKSPNRIANVSLSKQAERIVQDELSNGSFGERRNAA